MDRQSTENTDNDIWVFLSHSNKDYESVRLLRNMLEEEGYRPIMFFLLSLSDEEEIDSLIKREIDSRKLFILCDSKNARNSSWVQKEVAYIKSSKRYYQTIRMDEPIESIRDQIIQFRKDSTIYLFYSQESKELFPLVKKALQKDMGFKVHDWHDVFRGMSVKDATDKALENGYLFFLLPDGAPMTEFSMEDVRYALNHKLFRTDKDKYWEHGVRVCLLKDKPGTFAHEVVGYHVTDGEIVFDEEKMYMYVMLDRIREGAERKEPAAMYWLAYHNLHADPNYDLNMNADRFRRYTLNLAWESAEAGFSPAGALYKKIYYDILYNYPNDFKDNPMYDAEAKNRLNTLFPE